MDMKSWAVWAETKPQNEGNNTNKNQNTQENATYRLADPGCEAFTDPVSNFTGGFVAF
jgi:hypothetical protein